MSLRVRISHLLKRRLWWQARAMQTLSLKHRIAPLLGGSQQQQRYTATTATTATTARRIAAPHDPLMSRWKSAFESGCDMFDDMHQQRSIEPGDDSNTIATKSSTATTATTKHKDNSDNSDNSDNDKVTT